MCKVFMSLNIASHCTIVIGRVSDVQEMQQSDQEDDVSVATEGRPRRECRIPAWMNDFVVNYQQSVPSSTYWFHRANVLLHLAEHHPDQKDKIFATCCTITCYIQTDVRSAIQYTNPLS